MNFIPYGKQSITKADISAVENILRSDYLTQGPILPKFENEIAKKVNCKNVVAVNSATSALHIACLALGLRKNEWLWTSANTYVASANAGLYCNAKVDFVDIDKKTYNLSIDDLSQKLKKAKSDNLLPKIVMPVHFAGQSCDMQSIKELSEKYNFKIIEDASHAIGGKYLNQYIGSCQFSDISVFSFHPVKIITTGEGGAATTNDDKLYEKMRSLRSHGVTRDKERFEENPDDEIWNYQQLSLGFNYRMTEIQAGLGLSQLSSIDNFITKRKCIAKRYNEAFKNSKIIIPWQTKDSCSSYHLYPVRINGKNTSKSQKEIFIQMRKNNIGVNIHYIPVYRHPYYSKLGFKKGYCIEAERFFKEVLTIPIYPGLSNSEQEIVINCLLDLTKK